TNNNALNLVGTPGVSHTFPMLQPAKISFKVRAPVSDPSGFADIATGPYESGWIVHFELASGAMYVFGGNGTFSRSYSYDRWYTVSFTFDWNAKTFNWYVDESLVAANISFYGSDASAVGYIALDNWFSCITWW